MTKCIDCGNTSKTMVLLTGGRLVCSPCGRKYGVCGYCYHDVLHKNLIKASIIGIELKYDWICVECADKNNNYKAKNPWSHTL